MTRTYTYTAHPDMKAARNRNCWALGQQTRSGFNVRRIVWGMTMARSEVREGEEIRAAVIQVERLFKKRRYFA